MEWSIGVLEYWNAGRMGSSVPVAVEARECNPEPFSSPPFDCSIIPEIGNLSASSGPLLPMTFTQVIIS
jgi:hypothetical protein